MNLSSGPIFTEIEWLSWKERRTAPRRCGFNARHQQKIFGQRYTRRRAKQLNVKIPS